MCVRVCVRARACERVRACERARGVTETVDIDYESFLDVGAKSADVL